MLNSRLVNLINFDVFQVVGLPGLGTGSAKYNNLAFGSYNHSVFKLSGAKIQRADLRNRLKVRRTLSDLIRVAKLANSLPTFMPS